MQIDTVPSVCPMCGRSGVLVFRVLHHLICAYVGPDYDFAPTLKGYACPKCRRDIVSDDRTCEVVGASARCSSCHKEMVIAPQAQGIGAGSS